MPKLEGDNRIKVLVLAAGEGLRLRPYTLSRPKCMVEVAGRELLSRQLEVLRSRQLTDVVIITGHQAEALRVYDVKTCFNPRFADTNMVWSLFCANDHLSGEVVVSYGDIVYSSDTLSRLLESHADIAVTIDKTWEEYWRARNEDPLADAETLRLDSNGRILEIGQKPSSIEQIQGQYMGLMKFSATGIDWIRSVFSEAKQAGGICGKPPEKAYMTDLLQAVIDKGFLVTAVPVEGPWVEVDTVADMNNPVTTARLQEIERTLLR